MTLLGPHDPDNAPPAFDRTGRMGRGGSVAMVLLLAVLLAGAAAGYVYIGRENPIGRSAGCSLIISRFNSPYSERSYIGVLGPTRQHYRDVMNLVGRAGKTLEEVL